MTTMKRDGADIEASAQLVSKEGDDDARENADFDFDYADNDNNANDAYGGWSTQYRASPRQLWRRMRSVSLPNWLPIVKSNQLNPRYLAFIFGVSFVTTVLIVASYAPPRPTATSSIPAATPTTIEWSGPTHTPLAKPVSEFCTTWPVDAHGNYDLDSHDRSSHVELHSAAPQGGWQKPGGFKVVAMVFFGRKRYVDILDCYLQQNLASNGGYVDEVWFMVHTEKKEDVDWLHGLVMNNPDYKIVGQENCQSNDGKYGCLWSHATGDNTIYIKLDDDIVSYPRSFHPGMSVFVGLAIPRDVRSER